MRLLAVHMELDRSNCSPVKFVEDARVPFIRFKYKSRMNFTLSFQSGLSLMNSKLIK